MAEPRNGLRIWPYIIAVIIMALLGVTAILVLTVMRPQEDNIVVITLILGFLAPTTLSLLAFMKGHETNVQTKETQSSVNGRLDQFIKNAEKASHAEGILEGQDKGMSLVSRTQGPIESDPTKPNEPPTVGFKVTSIFMRRE